MNVFEGNLILSYSDTVCTTVSSAVICKCHIVTYIALNFQASSARPFLN